MEETHRINDELSKQYAFCKWEWQRSLKRERYDRERDSNAGIVFNVINNVASYCLIHMNIAFSECLRNPSSDEAS